MNFVLQHPSNSTSPNHFSTNPSTPDSGTDAQSLDPIEEFSNLGLRLTLPPSLIASEYAKVSSTSCFMKY